MQTVNGMAFSDRSHDLGSTGIYTMLRQRFVQRALDCSYTVAINGWCNDEIPERVDTLLAGFEVNQARRDRFRSWLASEGDLLVLVDVDGDGDWSMQAAGDSPARVEAIVDRFVAALPTELEPDESAVQVTFYCLGSMGPITYTRRLAAGTWDQVSGNYPAAPRGQLERLMAAEAPEGGGKLVLLHGPPGTGKTHAVRALAQSWAQWADVSYVVDPDAFFEHAAYMVGTMVMGSDWNDRWRLVVLEDSGEFLTVEAGQRPGGGLGRLLNLADGLVGQGLKLIVLMSTNEPIDALHPALTRAGRCMASIEFPAFDVAEANAWLSSRRSARRVEEPATLAELYAAQ